MLGGSKKVLATACLLFYLGGLTRAISSGFSFADACVNGCVGNSGCGINNPRCMCKAANGNLMEPILACMFWHCGDQLRDVDNTFLGPFKSECEAIGKPIPEDKLKSAKKVANGLVAKLGPATTTTTKRPVPTTEPVQSTTAQTTTKTTMTTATTRITTSASSALSPAITPTTPAQGPSNTPSSESDPNSLPTSQETSPTVDVPNSDPTDSSPFATPRGSANRAAVSVIWTVAPLALVLFLR